MNKVVHTRVQRTYKYKRCARWWNGTGIRSDLYIMFNFFLQISHDEVNIINSSSNRRNFHRIIVNFGQVTLHQFMYVQQFKMLNKKWHHSLDFSFVWFQFPK